MTNVFLCVREFSIIKEMMEYENRHHTIKIIGISTTVIDNLEELVLLEADVLVLQFSIDQQRCTQLLTDASMHDQLQKMNVLSLFEELDSAIIHILLQHDIQNFLVEPYTFDQLLHAISLEGDKKDMKVAVKWNIESIVSELMLEIGLPAHLQGFGYVRTSAILVARNFIGMRIVMGNVYSETARRHQTTASRVEKSIRTAIQYAYRTQPEKICIYNDKPTSSQIILYISEKIKLYEAI